MKVVAGAADFAATARASDPRPLAVAVGNFDGVHIGHQALLREARLRADARETRAAILTFAPHPARLFAPAKAPPLIMSLARRLELCAEAGIELAIVEPFTREFAATPADAFVRDVLGRDLGARDVVVGYDFSFGRGRAGDANLLTTLGASLGIDVAVIRPVAIGDVGCSSTRIRELVAAGDTVGAARLLGRPFELEGPVVRGAGRGRGLGFPTANIAAEGELRPALGIYAGRARVLDGPLAGQVHAAALSVGRNPTFTSGTLEGFPNPPATGSGEQSSPPPTRSPLAEVSVEAYLLDFDGDLYDRRVRVEVGARLRDELKFDSIAALVAQIERDVARVRQLV